MEERGEPDYGTVGGKDGRDIGLSKVSTKLQQVAELSRKAPQMVWTTLAHHMVLEAIYEQDFLDCSYGFRPGRSAHDALATLWQGLMSIGGGWVIDLDIQNFFDEVQGEAI